MEELNVAGKNLTVDGIFDAGISHFSVFHGKERLSLMLIAYRCKLKGNPKLRLSNEHSEYRWVRPTEAKLLLQAKFPKGFISRLGELE